jgi:hypothetical protein
MAILADGDIAYTAAVQGFKNDAGVTMVAVILAESGGNSTAHYVGPRDDSYGLAQINMIGSLGPARLKKYKLNAATDLYDPATNLRVAWDLSSHGSDFGPWSAYKNGRYKQFLPRAEAVRVGGGSVASGVLTGKVSPGDALDATTQLVLNGVAKMLGTAVDPFVAGLKKLTLLGTAVLLGVGLIGAGAWRSVKASNG